MIGVGDCRLRVVALWSVDRLGFVYVVYVVYDVYGPLCWVMDVTHRQKWVLSARLRFVMWDWCWVALRAGHRFQVMDQDRLGWT